MAGKSTPRVRRRSRLVLSHLALVEKVARRLARRLPAHVEIDDLISSGVIGLMEAAERFDPKRIDRFEAFAEFRIRGAMLDHLRANDSLSRDMRNVAKALARAARDLEQQLNREPTHDEIAGRLGVGIAELYAMKDKLTGSHVIGIDDAGPDLLNTIPDDQSATPLDIAAQRQEVSRLVAQINQLPSKQRQVLALYYVEDLTFDEIGKVMGFTMSRACQIHTEARRRLRLRAARGGNGHDKTPPAADDEDPEQVAA